MSKKVLTLDEKYIAFKRQRAKDRAGASVNDPAVLAGLAATVGPDDVLIVIKSFKADGVLYAVGDKYKPDDDREFMVRMLKSGFLLTESLYKKSGNYHKNKAQAEQVERLYLERSRQQTEQTRAKNAVEILQAELDQARARLAAAETAIATAEGELEKILG